MGLRESIATHVRLLVALPALFLAESLFSTRIHSVIGEMLAEGHHPRGRRATLHSQLAADPAAVGLVGRRSRTASS